MDDPIPEFGGYTQVANVLTKLGPRDVSRQCVRAWWLSRESSGFPGAARYTERGHKQFRMTEVITWYEQYVPPGNSHWGKRNRNE